MVIIKVIRHSGSDLSYLQNMIAYVTDSRAIVSGALGLNPNNPSIAYEQMVAVKKYCKQMSMNPLVHIVVSLDGACNNQRAAVLIAPRIVAYFKDNYQLMWCVHAPDESSGHHWHIHILLNSVNVQNGHLFHSGPYEMNAFGYHVKQITDDSFNVRYECIHD